MFCWPTRAKSQSNTKSHLFQLNHTLSKVWQIVRTMRSYPRWFSNKKEIQILLFLWCWTDQSKEDRSSFMLKLRVMKSEFINLIFMEDITRRDWWLRCLMLEVLSLLHFIPLKRLHLKRSKQKKDPFWAKFLNNNFINCLIVLLYFMKLLSVTIIMAFSLLQNRFRSTKALLP